MKPFNFRITTLSDGTEVIDQTLKTPVEALTPAELLEYTETENAMYYMDALRKREARKNKKSRKILARLVSACGII